MTPSEKKPPTKLYEIMVQLSALLNEQNIKRDLHVLEIPLDLLLRLPLHDERVINRINTSVPHVQIAGIQIKATHESLVQAFQSLHP